MGQSPICNISFPFSSLSITLPLYCWPDYTTRDTLNTVPVTTIRGPLLEYWGWGWGWGGGGGGGGVGVGVGGVFWK